MTEPSSPFGVAVGPTPNEVAAVREAIDGLPGVSDSDIVVVFLYPGIGVGKEIPEFSGCSSQMLQLGAMSHVLEPFGISVASLSTEDASARAHFPLHLRSRARSVPPEIALRLPHTMHDERLYLRRTTYILDTTGWDVAYTDIKDSVGHVDHVIAEARKRRLLNGDAKASGGGEI